MEIGKGSSPKHMHESKKAYAMTIPKSFHDDSIRLQNCFEIRGRNGGGRRGWIFIASFRGEWESEKSIKNAIKGFKERQKWDNFLAFVLNFRLESSPTIFLPLFLLIWTSEIDLSMIFCGNKFPASYEKLWISLKEKFWTLYWMLNTSIFF